MSTPVATQVGVRVLTISGSKGELYSGQELQQLLQVEFHEARMRELLYDVSEHIIINYCF
jgi:hypothetical protein